MGKKKGEAFTLLNGHAEERGEGVPSHRGFQKVVETSGKSIRVEESE